MNTAVKTDNISKTYPGVLANSNVSITINPSSIHAVVGENGAGKSTLMKILYGMIKPDLGDISFTLNFQPFADHNLFNISVQLTQATCRCFKFKI